MASAFDGVERVCALRPDQQGKEGDSASGAGEDAAPAACRSVRLLRRGSAERCYASGAPIQDRVEVALATREEGLRVLAGVFGSHGAGAGSGSAGAGEARTERFSQGHTVETEGIAGTQCKVVLVRPKIFT